MLAVREKLLTIKGDLFGGIIATIIAFPQALAFGVASGMGASAGIWGAIILSLFAGVLGCNLPLISGPSGPTAIIIATIVGLSTGNITSVITILAMASIFQMIIAQTPIPRMIKYVPYPVISGFLTGIGLIIIILQLAPLLGSSAQSSTIKALLNYPAVFSNINIHALILGLGTLFILFFTPKVVSKIIPSQLLALVIMTGAAYYSGWDIDKISTLTFSLPHFQMPEFSFEAILRDTPVALTLAFIATSESLLTGIIMDSLTKVKHNSKRLVLAQGFGNLFCALSGSMMGSAATMRSVAAVKSGASTRLAAILSAMILVLVLFKLNGFIAQIPICVLAAILIKIGYDILDLKVIKVLKFAPKDDLYVLIAVLLLTVFYNLIFALGIGVILAALLYAKRIADDCNIKVTHYNHLDYTDYETKIEKDSHYKIRILHIDGQFFFGSITQIVSHFDELLGTEYIILNYSSNTELDMSAIFALEDIIVRLQAQKIKLFLVIPNDKVFEQIKSLEIISQLGEDAVLQDENKAIDTAMKNIQTIAE
ncbi:SulP family inorganic anion transporter [bacterium]|nr:SulP family inorganic anion transporter [bacterium]